MSIWDKLREGVKVGAQVGQVAGAVGVPYVGSAAILVERVINNPRDPANLEALRELAGRVDRQDARLFALEKEVQALKQAGR